MMAINYVTSGAWGSGVNRPLQAAEVDGNFWNHDQRIANVELLEPGVGIESIVQTTPSQIAITLTNDAVYYFTLPPLELTFRGEWATNVFYAVNDVVSVTPMMTVYVVEVAHLSSSTGFSPGASDGAGNLLYGPLFTVPSNLPTGGTTDQVLAKVSGVDFNTAWQSSGIPRGGAAGLVLAKNSGADFDTLWQALTFAMITGSLAVNQLRFPVVTAISDGGTGTASLSPALGNQFTMAPANAVTLNAASAPADARVTLVITSTSATSFNVTFGTNFVTAGPIATSTTPGQRSVITFVGDGTNLIETSRVGPF
jgi:hypothetical protein